MPSTQLSTQPRCWLRRDLISVYLEEDREGKHLLPLSSEKVSFCVLNLPDCNKGQENGFVEVTGDWEFDSRDEEKLWEEPRTFGWLGRSYLSIKCLIFSLYYFHDGMLT